MAATGATLLSAAASSFSVGPRGARNLTAWPRLALSPADRAYASPSPAVVAPSPAANGSVDMGSLRRTLEASNGSVTRRESEVVDGGDDELKGSAVDYLEQAKALIRPDGGPPRWFSPSECSGKRLESAPLLLYLPGIDGVGVGLTRHHKRLGKYGSADFRIGSAGSDIFAHPYFVAYMGQTHLKTWNTSILNQKLQHFGFLKFSLSSCHP